MVGPINLDANLGGAGASFCADTLVYGPRNMSPSVININIPATPSRNRLFGAPAPILVGSAIHCRR